MATIQSAKDILINYDIIGNKDKNRHPKHEFQAYAYRLASDLQDLPRLQIYMRLAKTVERSLLEQAYAYTIDSLSDDKGKVFLWKVKQLRKEIEKQKVVNSFDYKTIIAYTTTLRNTLAEHIVQKASSQFWDSENEIFQMIFKQFLDPSKKQTILLHGLENVELLDLLALYPTKTHGIDISRSITSIAKEHIADSKHSPKPKLITKDFLKNTYDDSFFDVIFINSGWNIIPLEKEVSYIKAISAKLSTNGIIILCVSQSNATNQTWNTFTHKGLDYLFFKKEANERDVIDVVQSAQLQVEKRYASKKNLYFILTR